MKRTIHISIVADVESPAAAMSNPALAKLTKTLLDIGQADAADTRASGEGNLFDAERALSIKFTSISVTKTVNVLKA